MYKERQVADGRRQRKEGINFVTNGTTTCAQHGLQETLSGVVVLTAATRYRYYEQILATAHTSKRHTASRLTFWLFLAPISAQWQR
eukprot:1666096-Pleurochrysis_carterae.AAC.1